MTQRGYPEQSPLPSTRSGKDAFQDAPVIGNLAVQASLIQIFDEFSEVISGELKSMKLDEFNAERGKSAP